MSPLSLYVAITLAAALLSGGAVYKVQSWRYEAKDKARIEAQLELARNDRKAAQTASEGFENDRSKTAIEYRTIEVEVEKIVDRPVYRNTACWDADGLRALEAAVRTTGNPGKPEGAVSGVK